MRHLAPQPEKNSHALSMQFERGSAYSWMQSRTGHATWLRQLDNCDDVIEWWCSRVVIGSRWSHERSWLTRLVTVVTFREWITWRHVSFVTRRDSLVTWLDDCLHTKVVALTLSYREPFAWLFVKLFAICKLFNKKSARFVRGNEIKDLEFVRGSRKVLKWIEEIREWGLWELRFEIANAMFTNVLNANKALEHSSAWVRGMRTSRVLSSRF